MFKAKINTYLSGLNKGSNRAALTRVIPFTGSSEGEIKGFRIGLTMIIQDKVLQF